MFFAFFFSTLFIKSVLSDDTYIPCKSYISFSYDDSNTLKNDQFRRQMDFIKNAIESLNYPGRLRAEGGYGAEFTWNSKLNIAQMQSAIDSAEQTTISYSLLQQFSSLATSFEILNDYSNQFGAMIFISDTSDIALKNADRLFSKLKGIRLTFILLGTNVDTTKLRNFTSNFIYWPDLTQPQPDNWDLISYHAYGCDFPYTPTSTRLPISTTSSNIYYNYYPCQVMITAIVDISNSLNIEQFEKQLTFTKNVLSQVNHFERVRFGAYYEGNGNMTYRFNSTNNQQSLLETIDATTQTSLQPSLSAAMRMLIGNAYQNRTIPDSTIIFVTDTTNPIQIQSAHNFYNSVLKGRVRLTFILTGAKANSTQLQAFDDAIFFNWQNMNKSQPDGWDISQAFRCNRKLG